MELTVTLPHFLQMILAWLVSLLPAAVILAVILLLLLLAGIFFYAMGILRLFRSAVDLYLEQHDPKFADRRDGHGV